MLGRLSSGRREVDAQRPSGGARPPTTAPPTAASWRRLWGDPALHTCEMLHATSKPTRIDLGPVAITSVIQQTLYHMSGCRRKGLPLSR
jgi:hypothetical protein